MYYYARKFEILKFELAKIAKIYVSGFVIICILALQSMFSYSPAETSGVHSAWICYIYSGMIKVQRTFSKEDFDFIMLLIP